jgi:hypothetical protein
MGALPVSPNIHVVEHRTYLHTPKRWVALCVVQNEFGVGLKFYKWVWRDSSSQWKVDLARFSVTDIDLFKIASDAVELAKQYNISLHWPTLEEIGNVGVSVERVPECPSCGSRGRVEELETVTTWHCSECDQSWEGGQN